MFCYYSCYFFSLSPLLPLLLRELYYIGKGSLSHITTLLTLYLQTPYKHIRDLTSKLINETLSDSFMFRHDPDEVRPWLEALPRNFATASVKGNLPLTEEQTTVLQFVDECIERFSRSQYRYLDQAIDMLNNVNTEYLKQQKDNSDNSLIAQLLRSGESNDFPFSPLLLTVIQHLQSFKGDKRTIIQFITKLIVLLISKQKVPCYLGHICNILQDYVTKEQLETTTNTDREWSVWDMVQQTQECLTDVHENDRDTSMLTDVSAKNKQLDILSGNIHIS